ncbi:hypothetical protein, partial [Streptomyces sp. MBT72]|uniref:hypothetical protein n=1 Tax=Streptomyces sp. MBT72 TaxID=1488402 RepID=UPI001F28DED8
AVSRAMRDPYTTGSMIHATGEHAAGAGDSPDRAVNGPFVFARPGPTRRILLGLPLNATPSASRT